MNVGIPPTVGINAGQFEIIPNFIATHNSQRPIVEPIESGDIDYRSKSD
jgi:hypothetical protein